MLFLRVIEFAISISALWLMVTQLMLPLIFKTRFFPLFRNTELKKKVDETRDTVEDLADKTQQLSELEKLLRKKHRLEMEIAELEKPVADATNDGVK